MYSKNGKFLEMINSSFEILCQAIATAGLGVLLYFLYNLGVSANNELKENVFKMG